MDPLSNREMIDKAITVVGERKLAGDNSAGSVACALLSAEGHLYLGVCIDINSGIGFCAEHSAIAAMVTAGESQIARIVAVIGDGTVLPPCGRCRELIYQVDSRNFAGTEVILGADKTVKLSDLLPHPWDEVWQN